MRSPLLTVTAFIGAWASVGFTPAYAEAPPIDPTRLSVSLGERLTLALPGELLLTSGQVGVLPITVEDDTAGDHIPAESTWRTRLRFAPSLTLADRAWRPFALYQLAADTDLLNDRLAVGEGREILAYDPVGRVTTGHIGARLAQLYALAAGPSLALKVGLQRSRWGLGLLANGGEEPEVGTSASPFGEVTRSDRVLRAQVAAFPIGATRPGAEPGLTVAAAVDAVVDDDTAVWADGDRAYQLVAAVRGHGERVDGGLYALHRWQRHAEGGDTIVTVFDGHVQADLIAREEVRVFAEAEAAVILGSSSLAQSPLHPGAFDVVSWGGVGRLGAASGGFMGVIEVGLASGDDNPFDDQSHAFSFDREYRTGLLMFRELLRTSTAVTAANLADPTWRGAPPRGFDRVASAGAVRGASYVNPRFSYRPVDGLHLYVGLLYGASEGDYVDPFRASLAGGAAVGPNGALAADSLGVEIDAGVRYARVVEGVTLSARAELGWLDPGQVFDRAAGEEVDDVLGFWLHLGARW